MPQPWPAVRDPVPVRGMPGAVNAWAGAPMPGFLDGLLD
jgi:hypothetical protein